MSKIIAIVFALCTNVIAQLSLRKGMMNIDTNIISFSKVMEIVSSIYVWIGLFFYAISFTLYLYILSKFEVSYIYPIIMSAGFVVLLVFSVMFLNESFTIRKMMGIIIISAGILVCSV